MCLNKYLSKEDAMHGVVLHVHLLHFTWEGVAIPVLDCRYLLLLCANNCKEAGLNSSRLGSLVAWGYVYHL